MKKPLRPQVERRGFFIGRDAWGGRQAAATDEIAEHLRSFGS
ncbi:MULTISPECIES: hypothetical protein [unclassified Sphingobium]|nr:MULTISPECIES: hypothetical protein [unclassified Sphingobium]